MRELPYGNDRLTSKSNAADTRKKQKGGIAQLARASALQAEGRRFDSDYLHKIKTSFGRLFLWRYPSTPSRFATAPRGIPLSSSTPSGISVLRFPLVQIIEHADWPYSGVEWHFSCSMRSKWRHRASLSALQPPGTPLALLDELHEELFARGMTRRKAQERNAEKDKTRRKTPKGRLGEAYSSWNLSKFG